ncbi:MAG: tetratricopeptide repeat protein [Pseudomonadota bacterium]
MNLTHLRNAVEADPDNRDRLRDLASAQFEAGQIAECLTTYNRLIALGKVSADCWLEIGNALKQCGEHAQAVLAFRESLTIHQSPEAHHQLGQSLFALGQVDEAVSHLHQAVQSGGALGSRAALATMIPGAPGASHAEILAARREFADALAETDMSITPRAFRPRAPLQGRPIRVGYVSSWFAAQNYMKPVWALINRHDRSRFEVHLFSDTPEGRPLEGYEPQADDRLHYTAGLSNQALADQIEDASVDVLIDLNAYSTVDRLGLFTAPPAPVCVGWFNHFATSGLPGIHYLLGDEEVINAEEERCYREKIVSLPVSYLSFSVTHRTPPVSDPPCLRNGYLTFGSLVAQYKLTPAVIATWCEILTETVDSRLLLANRALNSSVNREWLYEQFVQRGVAAERIELRGGAEHYRYLQNYDDIDIALDAFPYNGGTTTMEAVWQGVPVLTFDAGRWAGRTSQTLLTRTHLARFAVEDRTTMVRLAVDLAGDPGTPTMLTTLRKETRTQLERSSVCDTTALARAMEATLEALAHAGPPRTDHKPRRAR